MNSFNEPTEKTGYLGRISGFFTSRTRPSENFLTIIMIFTKVIIFLSKGSLPH